MKQLKFLMIAFTLLMGISLTSCLNSESDPYSYGAGYAKAYSYMGMTTSFRSGDVTITPTAASVSSLLAQGVDVSKMDGHVVYVSYRWDPAVTEISNPKDIKNVELMGVLDLNNTTEVVYEKGASNDSVNNAAIIKLGISESSEIKPSFFDETTLLLPTNYFMYNAIHYLTLIYYPNPDDTTLKIYLHHNAKKDETSNTTSYNYAQQGYLGFFNKAYDLTKIFSEYNRVTNAPPTSKPTTVEIITKENSYTYKLDDAQTAEKTYTITYKDETEK